MYAFALIHHPFLPNQLMFGLRITFNVSFVGPGDNVGIETPVVFTPVPFFLFREYRIRRLRLYKKRMMLGEGEKS